MRFSIALVSLALALPAQAENIPESDAQPRPVVSLLVDPQVGTALSYTGTVVAKTETGLGFPMSGTVAARPVSTGDLVEKGDVLARLDTQDLNADLRTADASVTVAKAQLRSATDARERAKTLAERGVDSTTRLEDAERALVSAQAGLDQALASQARAADTLDLATLTAPYDGVVTETFAEPGATLSAGQTVLQLAAIGEREILIDLSEEEVSLRAPGDRFIASLLVKETIRTEAVLTRIDPVAERTTRTYRLHLRLENAPEEFRLGSLVRVLPAVGEDTSIVLPHSALLEPPAVWIVDRTSNTVSLRPVTVSNIAGDIAVITSGLSVGDEVVTKGIHSLEEGQAVGPRVSQ
ncbi:efflux RND transporter periplasmic adaptor subunit [Hoeflea ulvae]|uniref:Efflux RND transporter periplasmic adaptor subunit n=1 Tax=Hoeflea ulvae TaxID=2983764 RepID=A0ABT3YM65_9HYPH|nr:efflux RND transporter periplasmic adaptor subunit [Hoeflea ulvae]MCY0096677.1 efflux RND transporter periplasmic adaptor subunit [Hoeflea ulvae]